MVAFLLGNSNKSQYINVVHFVYSIVIFTFFIFYFNITVLLVVGI